MADGYSWSEMRDGGTYRLPGPEHLGWWAAVAMLVSILLHIAVFFASDRMKIALRFEQARELSTGTINVRQVEVRPALPEESAPPENVVQPTQDSAALLEEIDLLDALPKDMEIDIKPDIEKAEYALQMKNPAMKGDPARGGDGSFRRLGNRHRPAGTRPRTGTPQARRGRPGHRGSRRRADG